MRKLSLLLTLFLVTLLAYGQKPALDHSVYDSWKNLNAVSVPRNGDILMYTIAPQEGDVELVIENLRTGKKISVPRATRASLNQEGTKVIAVVKPFFSQTREAKIKKTKKDDMPKDSLAIIDLKTGNVEKIANYKSHNAAEKWSKFVAYEVTPAKEKADAKKDKKDGDKKEGGKKPAPKKDAKQLLVMNVLTAKVDTIKNVSSYKFNEDESWLAYVVEPEKKDSLGKAGLYLYNPMTGETKEVLQGEKGSKFKTPSFSEVGTMAFYANTDTTKAAKKNIDIYLYDIKNASLQKAAHNQMTGLQEGWIVSENAALSFSKDGKRLFFGTAPKPLEKDTTLAEFEQPQLDIWTWNEDYLQTVQLFRKNRDMKQTYTAYINTSLADPFVQLGTLDVPMVNVPNEKQADWVLVGNDKKYRIQSQWDYSRPVDIYLMNVKDGSQKLLAENVCIGGFSFSPDGQYAVAYDKVAQDWFLYTVATGEKVNLTENMDVEFVDDEHDTPSLASANGSAVWFEDSKSFLIRDKFDFWQFDPLKPGTPKMFTDGYGRKNDTQLSVTQIIEDPDKAPANPMMRMFGGAMELKKNETIYFTTYNRTTKQNGLAMKDKGKATVKKIVEGPYTFGDFKYSKPGKGKKGIFVYARGNFEEGNNLFASYDNFKTQKQMSDINPQQRDYNWGTVELVNWQTADDIFCEGLLFKPEDFDPNKKYPVMIYFYEKNANTLYRHRNPSPSRSTVNIPYFVSNGYVVFVPDVYFTEGHPGQSAMKSIMPGVEMLEKTYPWIDGENMAIQGQSWGGYQVAYMITQTNKFKAAGAGAPVSNMTSAYGGIRWGSGITRQVQYEQGQSRIGKTLWDAFDLYYENSPLFFAPNVQTPVLIMHNDKDGAVPWYQGIEFFVGLRRLGKVAWLLQYNNEEHNLVERRNCKDLSIRLSQFFDHYLKGAPMPEWMKNGRPAVKKGYDLCY
ncbi:MAG: S9 family peptidase [Bacteroides sp.]|nr:S9 family peptidase [Bacteroides sp.]